jgi:thymidylate kinase
VSLIIIRGPSGSGKSTVSNELLKRSKQPLMVIGEDKLRKMFSDHRNTPHPASEQLALEATRIGLEAGYHVVYQGILNVKSGEFQFDKMLAMNSGNVYPFYLDVAFDETVRRHQSRHKSSRFGADAMQRWWDYSSPLGHELETVIPGRSSLEETLQAISEITGLELMPSR